MGRRALITIAMALLVLGCGHDPEPLFRSRVGTIAVVRATAAEFTPLVAASTLVPRCEDIRNPPPAMGARVVSFVYGDPPERRVTIALDVNGKPTGYSDLRGDLISSDDHEGDFTDISINLLRGQAFAGNRPEHGPSETLLIPIDEAMSASNLDHPAELIERLLTTCASEANSGQ